MLLRALDVLAAAAEPAEAVRSAEEAPALRPLREAGHLNLMRAQLRALDCGRRVGPELLAQQRTTPARTTTSAASSPTRTQCRRPSSLISIAARSTPNISPMSGARPAIGPPSCPLKTRTSWSNWASLASSPTNSEGDGLLGPGLEDRRNQVAVVGLRDRPVNRSHRPGWTACPEMVVISTRRGPVTAVVDTSRAPPD